MCNVALRTSVIALVMAGFLGACSGAEQADRRSTAGQGNTQTNTVAVEPVPVVTARMKEDWQVWKADLTAPPLSVKEHRALLRSVRECWSAPEEGPRVELRVLFDRLGSATGAEVLDSEAMARDPLYREVAASARRALEDCGRLPLPAEKYETWREIVFSFYPSGNGRWPAPLAEHPGSAISDPDLRAAADGVRQRLEPCWNPPADLLGAEGLVVQLRLTLEPDGSVQRIEMLDNARMKDPEFKAAAEAAVSAVRSCSPLPLPSTSYANWRTLVLVFDPSQLLQQ